MVTAGLVQLGRFAQAQRALPFQPGFAAVGILQRHEQGVVRQPECVVRQKLLIIRRGLGQQTGAGAAQDGIALLVQYTIVDAVGRALPINVAVLLGRKQPGLGQLVKINKVGVAREGRERLIGTIAIAGGAHRQDLPVVLPCRMQEVHKFTGRSPHGTDAAGGRQAGNRQQNTAGSHKNTDLFLMEYTFVCGRPISP